MFAGATCGEEAGGAAICCKETGTSEMRQISEVSIMMSSHGTGAARLKYSEVMVLGYYCIVRLEAVGR